MKVRKLVNMSGIPMNVKLSNNSIASVPPAGFMENVDIENLDEVRNSALVIQDLTEVNESKSNSIPLRD
jgi:hypothetical protein